MSIPLSSLKLGQRLGDGGQAEVFRVNNREGEAFKRYRDNALPHLRPDVLEELAAETGQLQLEGRPITHWATWPTATVVDGGRVVGFLMPLLDKVFSMSDGNLVGKHASFSYLATKPAPIWGAVRLPAQAERAHLLALLAGVIQQLHHRKMVVGDLSWANVLWARYPEPRVILLDCDGIRPPKGTPVTPQLDTPDWNDPLAPHGSPPDADRDCYKFSLMVLRVLSQDLNARPSERGKHSLQGLAPDAARAIDGLLVRSASAPGKRPTATEWRQALQGRSVQHVAAPTPVGSPDLYWPGGQPRLAGTTTERRFRPVVAGGSPKQTPAEVVDPAPREEAAPADGRAVTTPPGRGRRWRPVVDPGSGQR